MNSIRLYNIQSSNHYKLSHIKINCKIKFKHPTNKNHKHIKFHKNKIQIKVKNSKISNQIPKQAQATSSQITTSLKDQFSHLKDFQSKLSFLSNLTKELDTFPQNAKTIQNQVMGCTSKVTIFKLTPLFKINNLGMGDSRHRSTRQN